VQVTSQARSKSDRALAARLGVVLRYLFVNPPSGHLRAIEESGLSPTQCKTLFVLAAEDGGSVKSVAAALDVSVATASRALDALAGRKLARSAEDEADRRVRRVEITAAGRRLADKLAALRVAGLVEFVRKLTEDQRDKLEAALDALLERDEIVAFGSPGKRSR
jgi:DNA-binding MarR family transcriptional regulator